MPLKNIQSINENTFSMRRNMFKEIQHIQSKQTHETQQQKKFYGNSNNRDASSVIAKRAIQPSSTSFPIQGKTVSYQGDSTRKDALQALTRTRAGGAVVPPKKRYNKG